MISVSNKKYAVVKQNILNNKDIIITENGNYYAEEPYSGLGVVRVQLPEPLYEEITLNPSITTQEILPAEGYNGISKITLNPVTHNIDNNIIAENIAKGVSILGVEGSLEFIKDDITINPSTTQQILNPIHDGFDTITVNPVTYNIDSNIISSNIKSGVSILGIQGNLIPVNNTTRDIYTNGLYSAPNPYTGFSQVNVQVHVEQEELNITPSTSSQTFEAIDAFHGFSPINVAAVTSDIDANIIASNIRTGVEILGVTGNLEETNTTALNVSENGIYTPESPYNGFSTVEVDVNTVNNTNININSNGIYTAESPYTGFGTVTVDINTVNNTSLQVTPNTTQQIFTPQSPYTGFSPVTVNAVNLQSKNIIFGQNTATTFTVQPDEGYLGLSSVTIDLTWIENQLDNLNAGDVDTSQLNLQEITVSNAGEYIADDGYDGIGKVTVNLDWVQQAIEAASQGNCDGTADSLIDNSAHSLATDALIIRNYAFYYNDQLQKVVLNLATSIGNYAFSHTNLNTLIINTSTLCTLTSTNAFSTTPNIYVKSSLVNTYKTDAKWSSFASHIFSIEDYTG